MSSSRVAKLSRTSGTVETAAAFGTHTSDRAIRLIVGTRRPCVQSIDNISAFPSTDLANLWIQRWLVLFFFPILGRFPFDSAFSREKELIVGVNVESFEKIRLNILHFLLYSNRFAIRYKNDRLFANLANETVREYQRYSLNRSKYGFYKDDKSVTLKARFNIQSRARVLSRYRRKTSIGIAISRSLPDVMVIMNDLEWPCNIGRWTCVESGSNQATEPWNFLYAVTCKIVAFDLIDLLPTERECFLEQFSAPVRRFLHLPIMF